MWYSVTVDCRGATLDNNEKGPDPNDNAQLDRLSPSIFHERWWLEAASSGRYREVTVEEGGRLVGRLPFVLNRQAGMTAIEAPTLTHFLGPAVDPGRGSANNRLLKSLRITRQLLEQLPPSNAFRQQLHRGCTDAFAFMERGYRVAAKFTFEIPPAPRDVLWAAMRDKTRNVIRRAEERHQVHSLTDPAEFIAFYTANLRLRGHRAYYDMAESQRLCAACLARGRGRLLATRTPSGELSAAIFYVWDAASAYFLMSSRDERRADNAVAPMLLWSAIRDSAARDLMFDMDGVGHAGLVLLFAGFGGQISPRFEPIRESPIYASLRAARTAVFRRQKKAFA